MMAMEMSESDASEDTADQTLDISAPVTSSQFQIRKLNYWNLFIRLHGMYGWSAAHDKQICNAVGATGLERRTVVVSH